ncbi:tetratricopeptide repeat protein [Streptomyces sp. NPDC091292]|uniref:tetratricopeptide repeat protein n=1 Tax=Streptomyces sp. NPDC091292 TaxID=3365991 RepID=UPI00382FE80A
MNVAAGGDVVASAIGDGASVVNRYEVHHHHHAPEVISWPMRIGTPPVPPSAAQPRQAVRQRIDAARRLGRTVVLTQVLSGGGGVGKSQLAAAYAREAMVTGTDLVVWVPAAEVRDVILAYARAAARVRAPGATGEEPEQDARCFLDWLAATNRSWLVVLDDVGDLTAMSGWWPSGGSDEGWVLATTRRRDAAVTGGGRRMVEVGVFTPRESDAYLSTRLTEADCPQLFDAESGALAEALGHLPLALSHAAAYMVDMGESCEGYLRLFRDRSTGLARLFPAHADGDGYGRAVDVTLLLNLAAADSHPPVGLASPGMYLAGLLAPAGHPESFWATTPVVAYFGRDRDPAKGDEPVTTAQARDVLSLLNRYGLLTWQKDGSPDAVQVHALTARAAREHTPPQVGTDAAYTAADALLAVWPRLDAPESGLAAVLRANASTLRDLAEAHLWRPEPHEVLFTTGNSLSDVGLYTAAVDYWRAFADACADALGPDHLDTIRARAHLASSYRNAGRTTEAIPLEEAVLADRERLLGPDHPDTLAARANLAHSYWQAGRTDEAVPLEESVLADRRRLLGPDHLDTIRARAHLASSYRNAGRTTEAIPLEEAVLADRERLLGPDHPDTFTARANLVFSYRLAGRMEEAVVFSERLLDDRERVLGSDHPDTLRARVHLASSYWNAGRTAEAVVQGESNRVESERVLGPDHPDTHTIRANLAVYYQEAGRSGDAIALHEDVLADRQRSLGPDHPDTLTAQANLADSYRKGGRPDDAVRLEETVLAGRLRVLGADHPDTHRVRTHLAASYRQAGRADDAVAVDEGRMPR